MKIFLDTNVVLSGAIYPESQATKLITSDDDFHFFYSDYVITECIHIIEGNCPDPLVRQFLMEHVHSWLDKAKATKVPTEEKTKVKTHDPNDQQIYNDAEGADVDIICTYDVNDFPSEQINVMTPISILKSYRSHIHDAIQIPVLEKEGTLLFIGTLLDMNSFSKILESENNTLVSVTTDSDGFVDVTGSQVKVSKRHNAIPLNKEITFVFRYKPSMFEASLWTRDGGEHIKQILTNGECEFTDRTRALLLSDKGNDFHGYLKGLSGVPKFVKEHRLKIAIENKSLESVTGSVDIGYVLKNIKMTPNGKGYTVEVASKRYFV